MTTFLLLLLLGGALGWAVTAFRRGFHGVDALINILTGSVISFLTALIVNGGTLYSGLSAVICAVAAGATLLGVGVLSWARRSDRPF